MQVNTITPSSHKDKQILGGKGTTQDHSTKVVELFKETNFRACVLYYQLWGYVFTLEIMGQLAISSIKILILYPSVLLYK